MNVTDTDITAADITATDITATDITALVLDVPHIPYISCEMLEECAEELLRDCSPESLITPGQVDIDSLMEYYIGLNIDFHNISEDGGILGLTAFNDGMVSVVDWHTGIPAVLNVKRGTVIIDTLLTETRMLQRLRFTMAHELAHWLLHRRVFTLGSHFGAACVAEPDKLYISDRFGGSGNPSARKVFDNYMRMEYQANFLASAILMPRQMLTAAVMGFFKKQGEADNLFGIYTGEWLTNNLTIHIARTFNVSKRTAQARLAKPGVIAGGGVVLANR